MKKIESISDAVNILIDAVNVAQNKGAYSFEDSTIIGQALNFLKESSTQQSEVENKKED